MILSTSTQSLEILLASDPTTECKIFASFFDKLLTAITLGSQASVSNATTPVTIVSASADSDRHINDISVFNGDTGSVVATIRLNDNGTYYNIVQATIAAGQTLHFESRSGWILGGLSPYKDLLVVPIHVDAGANFAMTNATQAERFALNTTRHIFAVDLTGYSQVRMVCNIMVGSASVNTPKFRVKYYTGYSATVGNYLQLGASAQVEVSVVGTGYADTGWLDLAAGAKISSCYLGFTELGGDAAADPALGHSYLMFR